MVDWALTLDALIMGIAREANPVMVGITQIEPFASFILKLGIPVFGGLVLYALRSHRLARFGLRFLAFTYAALVIYEIVGRLFAISLE
jgi:hypothetical protein